MTPDPAAEAERQIREAQAAGRFDDLEGAGEPLDLGDLDDPNWWIKAKLKRERLSVLPPLLAVRLEREKLLESLATFGSERTLRREVTALNGRIASARLGPSIGSLPLTVKPLDVEAVVADWNRLRKKSA